MHCGVEYDVVEDKGLYKQMYYYKVYCIGIEGGWTPPQKLVLVQLVGTSENALLKDYDTFTIEIIIMHGIVSRVNIFGYSWNSFIIAG